MVHITSIVAFLAASTVVSASHHFERIRHHVPVHMRAKAETSKNTPDKSTPDNSTSNTGPFVHPGVFVSAPQLAFVKDQVDAKKEPWASAFKSMMGDELMSLSRDPSPKSSVDCGSRSQNPSNGCTDEREDAMAAYGMALAFSITGQSKYAEKSADYMDAWAKTIKKHTASNAPLQTGWSAASWARAGELIKHTYKKWDSSSFENMLKEVYLPNLKNGDDRTGNWDLVMLESAIGISVFLDDKETYDSAMSKYKGRVPAYVYLKSDGKTPKAAPGSPQARKHGSSSITSFWFNQKDYDSDGIAQETCRDFVHTGYGLASISHVAETSLIQGENLYETEIGDRLKAGVEFHSKFQLGADKPSWLCPGDGLTLNLEAVTEPAYNAFSTQGGASMPNTKKLIEKFRDQNSRGNALFVAWETLTHAANPSNFGGAGNSTLAASSDDTNLAAADDSSSAPTSTSRVRRKCAPSATASA